LRRFDDNGFKLSSEVDRGKALPLLRIRYGSEDDNEPIAEGATILR
jgi:hypothetical protein